MIKKLLFIIGVLATFGLNAQERNIWDYPIKPGTKEWEKLIDHQEMLEVCQIPEKVLKNLPTDDLISICLSYPLRVDLYAYSTVRDGAERAVNHFNGFRELLSREDNFDNLAGRMERKYFSLSKLSGEDVLEGTLLETFLSFDEVLKNATVGQKRKLANDIYHLTLEKETLKSYFSVLSVSSSALLLERLMQELLPDTAKNRVVLSSKYKLFSQRDIDALKELFNDNKMHF